MTAAVLLGGGPLVIGQAATSAVLVATQQATARRDLQRLARDRRAVGGAIGVAVHALLLPVNPLTTAARAVEPVIEEMAAVLADVAVALRARDREAIGSALIRARGLDDLYDDFHSAMQLALDTARVAPPRRRARIPLAHYAVADPQLDLALRNVRVLAVPCCGRSSCATRCPRRSRWRSTTSSKPCAAWAPACTTRRPRRRRASPRCGRPAGATLALEQTGNLSVSVIVGQVALDGRPTCCAGWALSADEARAAVRAAGGRARRRSVTAPGSGDRPHVGPVAGPKGADGVFEQLGRVVAAQGGRPQRVGDDLAAAGDQQLDRLAAVGRPRRVGAGVVQRRRPGAGRSGRRRRGARRHRSRSS